MRGPIIVLLVITGPLAAKAISDASAPESLCGHAYTLPPTVDAPDSVGPLPLRSSLVYLRRSCPGARDTTSGFYLRAFGSVIEVVGDQPVLGDSADRVVGLIRVSGGRRIRTREGIGPWSTLREAKRAWGTLEVVGCAAGVEYAYVPQRPGLGLRFGDVCPRAARELTTYPDSVAIQAVEIFTPVD